MACGVVGLELNYFYSLNPRQFYNIVEGYDKKTKQSEKESWLQTRLIAFSAAHAMSDSKNATPEKWLPFPWEKKVLKKPKKTRAERAAIFKKIDRQNENKKPE